MKIILIVDIIIMVFIILFPYQFVHFISVQDNHFEYYILFTFIYSIIKCLSGFIFLLNKIKDKMILLHSKLYFLFLIPSVLISLLYSYLVSFKIFMWDFEGWNYMDLLTFISIIFSITNTIGILMWLINWTFYEKSIKIYLIILLNIITPISLFKLTYEVFGAYM